jgi:hypothetical protein
MRNECTPTGGCPLRPNRGNGTERESEKTEAWHISLGNAKQARNVILAEVTHTVINSTLT